MNPACAALLTEKGTCYAPPPPLAYDEWVAAAAVGVWDEG